MWFLSAVAKLNLNLEIWSKVSKTASFMFLSIIGVILIVLVWVWVQGNIIDTVKILSLLSLPFLFATNAFFKAHAEARA